MPLPFELPPARILHRQGGTAALTLSLSYEERFLRRKRLVTDQGPAVVVDLEAATSLDEGDVLECGDGTRVAVRAAAEPLLEVRGDLARLAWLIGNRHTPCQVEAGRLLIRRDHVLRDMLERLGARLADVAEPFRPEGGAYGFGRTHGHEH
jgi:urease accessory protein